MKAILIMTLMLTISGCATCERHPVACTAAVAVVVTSIALSVDHGHSSRPAPHTSSDIQPITCAPSCAQ